MCVCVCLCLGTALPLCAARDDQPEGVDAGLPVIPKPVDMDPASSTGLFGGVDYKDGMPTHPWTPRGDRIPDYDRRHMPANKVGLVNDPESVVGMSRQLMATDFAEADSAVFGSLLVSQLEEGTNVCGLSGATAISTDFTPIYGGGSPENLQDQLLDCRMTITAPAGHVIHVSFVTLDVDQFPPVEINVYDGDATDERRRRRGSSLKRHSRRTSARAAKRAF